MHADKRDHKWSTILALTAGFAVAVLAVIGCSSFNSGSLTTVANTAKSTVPVSITDAPSDQVLAASLTLNSVVLTDSSGATASILTSPLTFEAAHLDAVQEPLFTPAIPQDTYTSVTLTYSNAQVAYIDPTTKQLVIANATLANTSKTITFSTPVTVSNSATSLLIDYLVANSVSISGSTVTVTPDFKVSAIPIAQHPDKGTNGLQSGYHGQITALGTNQFTLTTASGVSITINVSSSTKYEDVTGFSALAVGMLVEVDTATQTDGSLLALRVEVHGDGNRDHIMLVGPITTVMGSPATSFTQVVRQHLGSANPLTLNTETITISGSTVFKMPHRLDDVAEGNLPFTASFSAATLFPGENVAVTTTGVSNDAATADTISPAPQTISGTITAISTSNSMTVYTLTLPSDSWVASLSGITTATVYTNRNCQALSSIAPAAGDTVRFNGFLFKVNGSLTMLANVRAGRPGDAIGGPGH